MKQKVFYDIHVHLSDEEFGRLMNVIEKIGINRSSFLRLCIFEKLNSMQKEMGYSQ